MDKETMEETSLGTKRRFVSPTCTLDEVGLSNNAAGNAGRLSNEIADDVIIKTPRTPTSRRSPDERVNQKGKGDIYTSTMSGKSNPRRFYQSKESKNERFEIPSEMLIDACDDLEKSEDTMSTDHETHTSQSMSLARVPHCSPRPPSPMPPPDDVENEALDFTLREDEDEEPIQSPTSGHDHETTDEANNDGFHASLSLEEYHQRGKPRKKTPKSAIKDSMKFEQQRFSRMKSAPQRSPVPSRSPDQETDRVLIPIMTNDTNDGPLSRTDSSSLPPRCHRKDQNAMGPMIFQPIHLKQEEERIKMNIWNHPLPPLPNIPSRVVSKKEKKSGTKSSMLTTPLVMAQNNVDAMTDHHAATRRNTLLSNSRNLSPSEYETQLESNRPITLRKVEVYFRSGGLTYFFPLSYDQRKSKCILPRRKQDRRERMQEREQRIADKLILKNNLTKKNLENLELAKKKMKDLFEARHETVRQRYQELLGRRKLMIQTSLKRKQESAKKNRKMLQKKQQDRFRRVQEKRKFLQVRKKMLSQIKDIITVEENATDLATEHANTSPNLPAGDVENLEGDEQNEESDDRRPGEGVREDRGNSDAVEHDDERERQQVEPQNADRRDGNDRRMGEIDNGNVTYVYEEDSGRGDDGSQDPVPRGVTGETRRVTGIFGLPVNSLRPEDQGEIPRAARGEDYENLRALLQLEATYTLEGHNGIGLFPKPNSVPEQQDYPVEGWSHYMLAIRAVRDDIEDLSAEYPDGTTSTGAFPIVFQDSSTAQGDHYDERDDTPSITDDEFLEEIEEVVGFVDEVLPQRESAPYDHINVRMRQRQGPRRPN